MTGRLVKLLMAAGILGYVLFGIVALATPLVAFDSNVDLHALERLSVIQVVSLALAGLLWVGFSSATRSRLLMMLGAVSSLGSLGALLWWCSTCLSTPIEVEAVKAFVGAAPRLSTVAASLTWLALAVPILASIALLLHRRVVRPWTPLTIIGLVAGLSALLHAAPPGLQLATLLPASLSLVVLVPVYAYGLLDVAGEGYAKPSWDDLVQGLLAASLVLMVVLAALNQLGAVHGVREAYVEGVLSSLPDTPSLTIDLRDLGPGVDFAKALYSMMFCRRDLYLAGNGTTSFDVSFLETLEPLISRSNLTIILSLTLQSGSWAHVSVYHTPPTALKLASDQRETVIQLEPGERYAYILHLSSSSGVLELASLGVDMLLEDLRVYRVPPRVVYAVGEGMELRCIRVVEGLDAYARHVAPQDYVVRVMDRVLESLFSLTSTPLLVLKAEVEGRSGLLRIRIPTSRGFTDHVVPLVKPLGSPYVLACVEIPGDVELVEGYPRAFKVLEVQVRAVNATVCDALLARPVSPYTLEPYMLSSQLLRASTTLSVDTGGEGPCRLVVILKLRVLEGPRLLGDLYLSGERREAYLELPSLEGTLTFKHVMSPRGDVNVEINVVRVDQVKVKGVGVVEFRTRYWSRSDGYTADIQVEVYDGSWTIRRIVAVDTHYLSSLSWPGEHTCSVKVGVARLLALGLAPYASTIIALTTTSTSLRAGYRVGDAMVADLGRGVPAYVEVHVSNYEGSTGILTITLWLEGVGREETPLTIAFKT